MPEHKPVKRKKAPHPTQPLIIAKDGVERFKANAIVRYLIDLATQRGIADMNSLAIMQFDDEDRVQFAQLIGYSRSGFSELSYVKDKAWQRAVTEGVK